MLILTGRNDRGWAGRVELAVSFYISTRYSKKIPLSLDEIIYKTFRVSQI